MQRIAWCFVLPDYASSYILHTQQTVSLDTPFEIWMAWSLCMGANWSVVQGLILFFMLLQVKKEDDKLESGVL